jgi:hypothetical protein
MTNRTDTPDTPDALEKNSVEQVDNQKSPEDKSFKEKQDPSPKAAEKLFPGQFVSSEVIQRLINGDPASSPVSIGEYDFDTGTVPEAAGICEVITPEPDADNAEKSSDDKKPDTIPGFVYTDDSFPPPSEETDILPASFIPRDTNRPPKRQDLQSLAQFFRKK